jgi:hypothetical protein
MARMCPSNAPGFTWFGSVSSAGVLLMTTLVLVRSAWLARQPAATANGERAPGAETAPRAVRRPASSAGPSTCCCTRDRRRESAVNVDDGSLTSKLLQSGVCVASVGETAGAASCSDTGQTGGPGVTVPQPRGGASIHVEMGSVVAAQAKLAVSVSGGGKLAAVRSGDEASDVVAKSVSVRTLARSGRWTSVSCAWERRRTAVVVTQCLVATGQWLCAGLLAWEYHDSGDHMWFQAAVALMAFEWLGGLFAACRRHRAASDAGAIALQQECPPLLWGLTLVGLSGVYFRLYPWDKCLASMRDEHNNDDMGVRQLYEYRFALAVQLSGKKALTHGLRLGIVFNTYHMSSVPLFPRYKAFAHA